MLFVWNTNLTLSLSAATVSDPAAANDPNRDGPTGAGSGSSESDTVAIRKSPTGRTKRTENERHRAGDGDGGDGVRHWRTQK